MCVVGGREVGIGNEVGKYLCRLMILIFSVINITLENRDFSLLPLPFSAHLKAYIWNETRTHAINSVEISLK